MKIKEGYEDIAYYDDECDDAPDTYMVRVNASQQSLMAMLSADEDDNDGRSQWFWFWLPNGDRIFGAYPQGDTFLETEIDSEVPQSVRNGLT